MWEYTGQHRPSFAEEPGPGQESVWDYPRPPALVSCESLVEIQAAGALLASTRQAQRVLETASPPTYYLPPDSVDWSRLVRTADRSYCEWKGGATYWHLTKPKTIKNVAWSYEEPKNSFKSIAGYVSFYPAMLDCFIDGERVRPQPGGFYGGWVTNEIVGPFKGQPDTSGW